ncbi:PREDICTED: hemocytin-like isoform X2 [Branchiostoma belcheri]|uniref:Hemocytin-like isoform X2 n=1 Tax=Branchiostoma belcheri TaxID=7741 RepID=A0A6P4ZB32_BRABE|nr:PREDICTED: hemocytin-like isoform X2 [Branchiostoma belcheri]
MASSERGPGFLAKNSRLGLQETATSAGAWSAQKPWLRFDLGRPKTVTTLVTQGRSYSPDWPGESHSEWVTSYSISYGNENGDEAWYTGDDGQAIVFKANTDRDSKVRQDLSEFSGPFTARYVKIHPLTWHGWVSMRAGISTEPPSWSASSEFDSLHSAARADINSRETADAAGAWAAATNDQDQWLMRDLGDVSVITGVITKGRNYSPDWPWDKHDQYVTSYTISYGNEIGDETFYTDADGQVTVFPANDDRDTEVYNDFRDFSGRITARFVKIHPQTWHEHISMRAKIVTATQKWREDLRCGAGYTTADGRTAECDPDSIYPCCSPNNWCGNTADHCDCADCVDYRDTVATQKWREDLRCGAGYTTADGRTAECDPDSIYPCCSPNNWCGNTADHCDCAGCVDYRDTVATQKWREDLRCGAGYTTADGRTAECDPDSIYPCCSPINWCGNTADHCDCADCVDYRDTDPILDP